MTLKLPSAARRATRQEVRNYFKFQDCEVKISTDNHVTYRKPNEPNWREGRYLSEYWFVDGLVVHT